MANKYALKWSKWITIWLTRLKENISNSSVFSRWYYIKTNRFKKFTFSEFILRDIVKNIFYKIYTRTEGIPIFSTVKQIVFLLSSPGFSFGRKWYSECPVYPIYIMDAIEKQRTRTRKLPRNDRCLCYGLPGLFHLKFKTRLSWITDHSNGVTAWHRI